MKTIETTLHTAFSPEKMNYLMLMMVDDHLHFHVLPRYAETKVFADLEWSDSGWPGPPGMNDHADRADDRAIFEVCDFLKLGQSPGKGQAASK